MKILQLILLCPLLMSACALPLWMIAYSKGWKLNHWLLAVWLGFSTVLIAAQTQTN